MKLKTKYRKKVETLEEIAVLAMFICIFVKAFLFLVGIDL